ncbi:MAG: AAA family ATPase, partial [Nitrospinota bacterium]|nr:AAA family ATPase [Nitrospinota bacterium]
MKIESIKLRNFKTFKETEIKDIPNFCVLVGANGVGKSTLLKVFGFLKEAMMSNVSMALAKYGGSIGFKEVRSRGCEGNIEIQLQFRIKPGTPLVTYFLSIGENNGSPYVSREFLRYKRVPMGAPWHFLEFKNGKGWAVTNEFETTKRYEDLKRVKETLKSKDILAIKGLAQFERFPAVRALGDLIENWQVSDLHISKAQGERAAGYAAHLSSSGDNLPLVTQYLHDKHRKEFGSILRKMEKRVPGFTKIEAVTNEEGRVRLKFHDSGFKEPFLAHYVSDGTIKMFAYMVLLNDPNPHPLLCVEEPENQLYPLLLEELAEEFRDYANRGGQVFVSTHSPDFLNAVELGEVFWLVREKGYTKIKRARDDEQIREYMEDGDKMGRL